MMKNIPIFTHTGKSVYDFFLGNFQSLMCTHLIKAV